MLDFSANYGTVVGNATSSFVSSSFYIMVFGDGVPQTDVRRKLAVGGFSVITGSNVYEAAGNPLCLSDVMTQGKLEHIVVNKVGSLVRIWQNGALKGSGTSNAAWNFEANGLLLGRNGWDGSASYLSASIVDMKVRTVPTRTAAFTPPAAPAIGLLREGSAIGTNHPSYDAVCNGGVAVASVGFAGYRYPTDGAGGTRLAAGLCGSSAPQADATISEASGLLGRDLEFGGPGVYPFTVEGLPDSQKARVTLLRARDKLVVRETWSTASGTGEFTGLDLATKFIAVAQDPAGLMHPCGAEHFPKLPGGAP